MPDEPPPPDVSQGKRTEQIVRQYDDQGALVSEQVTVTRTLTPQADEQPMPGAYL
jgi:hypothetical protein